MIGNPPDVPPDEFPLALGSTMPNFQAPYGTPQQIYNAPGAYQPPRWDPTTSVRMGLGRPMLVDRRNFFQMPGFDFRKRVYAGI